MAALLKIVYKLSGHSSGPVLWGLYEGNVLHHNHECCTGIPTLQILQLFQHKSLLLTYPFTREMGCITQGIFHVLYKLNFLKWNPPSSEENALIEPVSKVTSCSTRRCLLHSGFEFSRSISPIPLFWPAAKTGEKGILHMPCLIWCLLSLPRVQVSITWGA